MEQIWTEFLNQLPSLIGVIAVAVFGYLSNIIRKHIKNADVFNSLEQLAEDAVVLAEKSGAIKGLTGSEKFEQAVTYINKELAAKGITSVTEDQIKAGVETAFVNNKIKLENAYAKDSETALEAKLASAQSDASSATSAVAQAQSQASESKAEAVEAKATLANIISAASVIPAAASSTPESSAVPTSAPVATPAATPAATSVPASEAPKA